MIKKIFLGVSLSILSFIGFSSAVSISCNGNSNETNCDPYGYDDPYVADEEVIIKLTSVGTCYDENLISIDTPNSIYGYSDLLNGVTVNGGESISFFYYTSSEDTQSCQFNVSFGNDSEGGDGDIGGVIEGGFSQFSPLFVGLSSVTFEIIPYVVYISIGLLIAILGFVGIKWLVSWLYNKIFGNFK